MRSHVALSLLIFSYCSCVLADNQIDLDMDDPLEYTYNRSSLAKGRLLQVTVQPDTCTTTGSGNNLDSGVCFPRKLCVSRGGRVIPTKAGACGRWGICCLYSFSPTSRDPFTVNEKISTITPNMEFARNVFIFPKIPGYCQLKVDFLEFAYADPTTAAIVPTEHTTGTGTCILDSLRFRGSVTVTDEKFTICGGVPSDRPFYLAYGSTGENIRMIFRSTSSPRKTFKLRVTHIGCDSEDRVDDRCLLQYESGNGRVESFGYGKYQIEPQEYNVCIGSSSSSTGASVSRWTMCPPASTTVSSFYLSNYFGPGMTPLSSPLFAGGFGDTTCERTSYVAISQRDKYCGAYFAGATGAWSNVLTVRFIADSISKFAGPGIWSQLAHNNAGTKRCDGLIVPATGTVFTDCSILFGDEMLCKCHADGGLPNPVPNKHATGFCLEYN